MDIAKIRMLPQTTAEEALALEQACTEALILRPESEVEHAELLFLLAGARAFSRENRPAAAPLAYRAYKMAFDAKDYVLAMQARCLHLYCIAHGLTLGVFWTEVMVLRTRVNTSWKTDLNLTPEQLKACSDEVTRLETYGDKILTPLRSEASA